MHRRDVLKNLGLLPLLAGCGGGAHHADSTGVTWGIFNRMFREAGSWPGEFDSMKAAGFTSVGLTTSPDRGLAIRMESVEQDRESVRGWLAERGMSVIVARHLFDTKKPAVEAAQETIPQMQAWHDLGTRILWFTGTAKPEEYQWYYEALQHLADAAAPLDMELHVKPHGGLTATGDDCAMLVETVQRDNVHIFYDPGNILYYTGLDPVQELKKCVAYVKSLVIKDCVYVSEQQRDVMVTPGDGDVDFPAVFDLLESSGFNGPRIIETVGAKTIPDAITEAKRAMEYLTSIG